MKITKTRYIQLFFAVVFVLMLVKCMNPQIARPASDDGEDGLSKGDTLITDSVSSDVKPTPTSPGIRQAATRFVDEKGNLVKNRIYSVPRFSEAFPDSNSVQLTAARQWGVSPVKDRRDAETRKAELVYIGASPYYTVDKLKNSIPYLVPRASVLLDHIGQAFFDSLQVKGVPLHKFIVTSVLRSRDDVESLRGRNGNATANSCHLYGTTFDICYNRYTTVSDPDGVQRRAVRNDTLKWVLSEVLRDMRVNGRCYIKYEVKQGCFHLTVR